MRARYKKWTKKGIKNFLTKRLTVFNENKTCFQQVSKPVEQDPLIWKLKAPTHYARYGMQCWVCRKVYIKTQNTKLCLNSVTLTAIWQNITYVCRGLKGNSFQKKLGGSTDNKPTTEKEQVWIANSKKSLKMQKKQSRFDKIELVVPLTLNIHNERDCHFNPVSSIRQGS